MPVDASDSPKPGKSLYAIVDKVELSDVNAYKRDMMVKLADFKEHRDCLKGLNVSE